LRHAIIGRGAPPASTTRSNSGRTASSEHPARHADVVDAFSRKQAEGNIARLGCRRGDIKQGDRTHNTLMAIDELGRDAEDRSCRAESQNRRMHGVAKVRRRGFGGSQNLNRVPSWCVATSADRAAKCKKIRGNVQEAAEKDLSGKASIGDEAFEPQAAGRAPGAAQDRHSNRRLCLPAGRLRGGLGDPRPPAGRQGASTPRSPVCAIMSDTPARPPRPHSSITRRQNDNARAPTPDSRSARRD